jgi:hypothetical protein
MTWTAYAMSSEPEKPRHKSQPKKARPLLGHASQAGMESDLWDLEKEAQDSPDGARAESAAPLEADESRGGAARKWVSVSVEKDTSHKNEKRKMTGVSLDIHPKGVARTAEQPPIPARRVEAEFSALDDWEEEAPVPAENAKRSEEANLVATDPDLVLEGEDVPVDLEPNAKVEEVITTEKPELPNGEDVPTSSEPAAKPVAPMRLMEWAALAVLALVITALAIGAYFWSIHRLPKKAPRWQQISFPMKGERFEIKNATTYWRAPVTEGPDRDPIRRGTSLMPVIELEVAGGPAALRVIFRDDQGRGVGDPIIRSITTSGKFALAATAGFEDPGMHAAYRTEELEPWVVEVSEAASAGSSGSDFSLVMKMNISPDLR